MSCKLLVWDMNDMDAGKTGLPKLSQSTETKMQTVNSQATHVISLATMWILNLWKYEVKGHPLGHQRLFIEEMEQELRENKC